MRCENFLRNQKQHPFNHLTLSNLQQYCLGTGVLAALACNCSVNEISETIKNFNCENNQPNSQFQNIAIKGYINFVVPHKENESDFYQHTCNLKRLELKFNNIDNFYVKEANESIYSPQMSIAHLKFVFESNLKNGTESACLIEELLSVFNKLDTYSCKIEGKSVDFITSVVRNGQTFGFKTGAEQISNPLFIQRVIDNEVEIQMLHFNSNDLPVTDTNKAGCNTFGLTFVKIAEIIQLVHSRQITLETADDILEMLLNGDERSINEIVETYNWLNISDESMLEEACKLVLSRHIKEAKKFRRTGRRHHMNILLHALREIHTRASQHHAEEVFKKLICIRAKSKKA